MNFTRLLFSAMLICCAAGAMQIQSAEYAVGPGKPYPTLASLPNLAAGDTVSIYPGTYNEVKRWRNPGTSASPITIRGIGSPAPVIDANGLTVDGASPNPRAAFQVEASYITIENLEFKNAHNGNNGAGVRITGSAITNTILRGCKITQCDMGVMSDGNDNLLIDSCEIASNGTPLYDGYSHNLYLNGNKTTVQYCYIHDATYGQNFKTRGHYTELLYNYISDSQDGEVGLVDSALTTTANSNAVMIGNIVISKPRVSGYNSQKFIQFGQDGGNAHTGTLYASNNTFYAGDNRIRFLDANAPGASILASNNIFYNSPNVATSSGPVSGANNWAPNGFVNGTPGLTGTVAGSTPGFVNTGARDFHLAAGSACINIGTSATYVDGTGAAGSATPTQEYVNHLQHAGRNNSGALDAGAYENAAAVPTTYSLTVNSGSGGGTYAAGTNVTITANAAPVGQTFDQWVVNSGTPSIANVNSASTTLTTAASAATVTATYKAIAYALTITNGSGSGTYVSGTNVTITANAAPAGQTFDKWVVNSGTPSIANVNNASTTLTTAASAATVTATYKAIAYALTITNGSGSGTYVSGTNVTITANAAPAGQTFDKWVVNSGTPSIANVNNASTTLTTTASVASVTATYKLIPPATYALTVNSGSGSGTYVSGANVTITANAAPAGQMFDKWVVNSGTPSIANVNSSSTTLTTSASAASVTATYKAIPPATYALTVNSGSGSGTYVSGTNVTITANAAPAGQTFDKWVVNSGTPSIANVNSASTTLTTTASTASVTATYKVIPPATYTLTVNSGSGSGTYVSGTNVTITANAAPAGQTFDKWLVNSGTPSIANVNSASTTLTTTASAASVTPTYKAIPPATYALTVNSGSGSGTYVSGTNVTITANTAPAGQMFDKWVVNSGTPSIANVNSTTTTLTTTASAASVTATFKAIPPTTYTLTVNSGSGSGTYVSGTNVTITANSAPAAQTFDKWVVNSGTPSIANVNSASTTLTTTASATSVTATYKAIPPATYALTVNSGSGSGTYVSGTNVTITANAAPAGQVFDKWVVNSGTPSIANVNSASTTLTTTASAASVTATYKANAGNGTGLKGEYFANQTLSGNPTLTRTDATVNFNWGSGTPDASIPVDHFSARWTGQVKAQFSQVYTFYTSSDDGVRLWVNGVQIINNWTDHSPTENSGTIILVAGQLYDLKMEFYENGGGAVATLSWSSASTAKTIIPQSQLFPALTTPVPPSTGSGLKGDYFANMTLSGAPTLTRTDATVDFNWGTAAPDASIPAERFGVRWSGQVQAQFNELYTFYTQSDDGIRLWVNGVQVINNWTDHSSTENSGAISLVAGQKYDVVLEFYENGVDAVAQLKWSSASTAKAIIPQSQLFPPAQVAVAKNLVQAPALAAPWQSLDIGAVKINGEATGSNSVYVVKGAGVDVGGTGDQFQFMYRTLTGDGEIVARVNAMNSTNANAKAGVMMRAVNTTSSPMIFACVTPGGTTSIRRNSTGAGSNVLTKNTAAKLGTWVKVTRLGNTFSSYRSADGVTWTKMEQVNLNLGSSIQIGLAVSSTTNDTRMTAEFSGVSEPR